MQWHFCMHDGRDIGHTFPKGKYCVFKKSTCPEGMHSLFTFGRISVMFMIIHVHQMSICIKISLINCISKTDTCNKYYYLILYNACAQTILIPSKENHVLLHNIL